MERAPYSERRQCNKEVDVCLSDWGAVVRNVDLRDVVSAIHSIVGIASIATIAVGKRKLDYWAVCGEDSTEVVDTRPGLVTGGHVNMRLKLPRW